MCRAKLATSQLFASWSYLRSSCLACVCVIRVGLVSVFVVLHRHHLAILYSRFVCICYRSRAPPARRPRVPDAHDLAFFLKTEFAICRCGVFMWGVSPLLPAPHLPIFSPILRRRRWLEVPGKRLGSRWPGRPWPRAVIALVLLPPRFRSGPNFPRFWQINLAPTDEPWPCGRVARGRALGRRAGDGCPGLATR